MVFRPETVIGWQRAGLRMFWRWKSRRRPGRPAKDRELIQLIRRMWSVNPTWGSPRIRDELAKLGLQASTATIRKYRPRSRRLPSQSWRTFLQNHAAGIAAMDFFVVPTVTARLLYVLVVLNHERRKIVHFNITDAPTAAWTAPLILVDDLGIASVPGKLYREFLEMLDDRQGQGATLITSQFPVNQWHEVIADPTVADAILDRLVHNAYRIELKGESLRKGKTPPSE